MRTLSLLSLPKSAKTANKNLSKGKRALKPIHMIAENYSAMYYPALSHPNRNPGIALHITHLQ
jgi:hypothetical protein